MQIETDDGTAIVRPVGLLRNRFVEPPLHHYGVVVRRRSERVLAYLLTRSRYARG
jgi:hypothetical protein